MLPIKSIMSTDVISATPDMPIYEAMELLIKNKISGLPVVDGDLRVVGILSEKDVLRILLDGKLHVDHCVKDYMTLNPICFTEMDSAIDVCKFFINSHIRRVPILRDGKLAGVVARKDIVSLIAEARGKLDNIRYV